MDTKKLIEAFPKGNPPIQLDVFKAVDHYIGLNNVYEVDTSFNFTLIFENHTYIFLKKELPPKRKHFVLAHELVEYLLEQGKEASYLPYYIYKGSDRKFQSKVNQIVASLLMPDWVVREILTNTFLYGGTIDERLIKELSDFFNISKRAVIFRLKSLRYEVPL